jgi:signal transduction histidine kinase
VDVMADDPYGRIAHLEAQVRQFQNLHATARTEIAVLRAELGQRDDPAAEDAADRLSPEAYDRLYGTAVEEARPEAPLDYDELVAELERRTRELGEARDQEAATAEILRTIAAAPTDVQPVLDAICESAMRLSHSPEAALGLREGDFLRLVAGSGEGSSSVAYIGLTWPLTRRTDEIYCVTEARTIYVPDGSDPAVAIAYPDSDSQLPQATLTVPMMHEGKAIGMLRVARPKVRRYSAREIALVETFADQAAIAVANARLFEELQAKSQELEIASQHKSTFLANMSHELRTPLNAIIGYSEMLQEEAEEVGVEAFIPDLQKVNAAGKHLLGLINDILDLSKIEAGKMDLFLETFSVPDLVRDVAAIVGPLVDKNANALVVDCPDDAGTMHADLTKVRQALFNLLSNAAKFTDHGTISLTVRREAEDWVTLAVADSGIGMTEEQLGRLFGAFSQAEASTRSDTNSIGSWRG